MDAGHTPRIGSPIGRGDDHGRLTVFDHTRVDAHQTTECVVVGAAVVELTAAVDVPELALVVARNSTHGDQVGVVTVAGLGDGDVGHADIPYAA